MSVCLSSRRVRSPLRRLHRDDKHTLFLEVLNSFLASKSILKIPARRRIQKRVYPLDVAGPFVPSHEQLYPRQCPYIWLE